MFHYFVEKRRLCYTSGISRRGGLWEKIANKSPIDMDGQSERALALDQKKAAGFIDRAAAQSVESSFRFCSAVGSRSFFLASLRTASSLLLPIYCPDESWLPVAYSAPFPSSITLSVQLASPSICATFFSILDGIFLIWADSTPFSRLHLPERNVHTWVTLSFQLTGRFFFFATRAVVVFKHPYGRIHQSSKG